MSIWKSEEVAEKLGCTPEHVNRLAASGKLKGAKIGRGWVFVDNWVMEFLHECSKNTHPCQSTNAMDRRTGISSSPSSTKRYADLLALPTGKKLSV